MDQYLEIFTIGILSQCQKTGYNRNSNVYVPRTSSSGSFGQDFNSVFKAANKKKVGKDVYMTPMTLTPPKCHQRGNKGEPHRNASDLLHDYVFQLTN